MGSNISESDINSCSECTPNDLTSFIKRVRNSNPPKFIRESGPIRVSDWTSKMFHTFKMLVIPSCFKKKLVSFFFF